MCTISQMGNLPPCFLLCVLGRGYCTFIVLIADLMTFAPVAIAISLAPPPPTPYGQDLLKCDNANACRSAPPTPSDDLDDLSLGECI